MNDKLVEWAENFSKGQVMISESSNHDELPLMMRDLVQLTGLESFEVYSRNGGVKTKKGACEIQARAFDRRSLRWVDITFKAKPRRGAIHRTLDLHYYKVDYLRNPIALTCCERRSIRDVVTPYPLGN